MWRSDAAPVGRVVEVLWRNHRLLGYFDGLRWRSVDGQLLEGVTQWRPRGEVKRVRVRRMFPQ